MNSNGIFFAIPILLLTAIFSFWWLSRKARYTARIAKMQIEQRDDERILTYPLV